MNIFYADEQSYKVIDPNSNNVIRDAFHYISKQTRWFSGLNFLSTVVTGMKRKQMKPILSSMRKRNPT